MQACFCKHPNRGLPKNLPLQPLQRKPYSTPRSAVAERLHLPAPQAEVLIGELCTQAPGEPRYSAADKSGNELNHYPRKSRPATSKKLHYGCLWIVYHAACKRVSVSFALIKGIKQANQQRNHLAMMKSDSKIIHNLVAWFYCIRVQYIT